MTPFVFSLNYRLSLCRKEDIDMLQKIYNFISWTFISAVLGAIGITTIYIVNEQMKNEESE